MHQGVKSVGAIHPMTLAEEVEFVRDRAVIIGPNGQLIPLLLAHCDSRVTPREIEAMEKLLRLEVEKVRASRKPE